MELRLIGTLKLTANNSFQTKDTGEQIETYTNYIQFEDKEGKLKIAVLNSKESFDSSVGKQGIAIVRAYKTKAFNATGKELTVYKLTLSDFDTK